jgi:hypothetical protein
LFHRDRPKIQLTDLRAQFQKPERKRIITHARPPPMRRSLFST